MSALDARSARRRYLILIGLRWLPIGLLIPVLVLLALSRGFSLTEIGVIFSVQGLVVLALELPTGGLADALGRRSILILASLVGVFSLGLLYVADSVALFATSMVLQGIFRALDSGPLEAWYVDATLAADPDAEIEKGLSAGTVVLSVAIAVGALASGALVALDPFEAVPTLALPLLVALVLGVANLIAIVALMTEVRVARGLGAVARSVRAVPTVVGDGIGLLRASHVLLALVAVELFWGFAMVTFETLFPVRLSETLGDTDRAAAIMGPVSSIAWLAAAAGAAGVVLVSNRVGVARSAAALRIVQGSTVLAMGLIAGPIGIVTAFLACYARTRRLQPDAHDAAPSRGRWPAPRHRPVDELDGRSARGRARGDHARGARRRDVDLDGHGRRRDHLRARGAALYPGLAGGAVWKAGSVAQPTVASGDRTLAGC